MHKILKKPHYHIAYWILVILVLLFAFRPTWGNGTLLFFFVSMMLPIVLGTSYFFNYVLVPKFYLTKRYARFTFYTFCTAIISVYLEILVIVFAFVYLSNFSYVMPNTTQITIMTVIMYMLVFVGSFLLMMNQITENRQVIQSLIDDKEKREKPFLEIMSNRKMIQIPHNEIIYIESLSDYIKVITIKDEIKSKEKISKLSERLPDVFLRIHRSFIINTEKIKQRSLDQVLVDNYQLNIGRSYRKDVKELLNSRDKTTTIANKYTSKG